MPMLYEKTTYDKTRKEIALKTHLFSEAPALHCLVVEVDAKLVGYTTYMRQFSTWDACLYLYMDCLFLTEQTRGKGIGQLLMGRLQQDAEKMECPLLQWQKPDFNIRAIRFYDRLGVTLKNKKQFFLKEKS